MSSLGIRHAAIGVTDLARALEFYTHVLDFAPYHVGDPDWAMLRQAGTTLSLILVKSTQPAPDYARIHSRGEPHPVHFGLNMQLPADVDALHVKMTGLGVKVKKTQRHRDGSYGFYFTDSEGNRLECIFIPQITLEAKRAESWRDLAVILFAHGAAHPGWTAPVERLRAQVGASLPGTPCEVAYLEFSEPTLAQAIASVARNLHVKRVAIAPVFLATGAHVTRDLPELLHELRAAHSGLSFHVLPALGESALVTEALCAAVFDALAV